MKRSDPRHGRSRSAGTSQAEPMPVPKNLILREIRFETPEASAMFLNLRYLDSGYKGARDSGIRLPGSEESVSKTASSGGMVYQAFPHGLMYGDQMSLMGGVGLFLAGIGLLICFKHLIFGGDNLFSELFFSTVDGTTVDVLVGILWFIAMLAVAPFALLIIVGDVTGYRFNTSVLFDRNAGKIHVFSDESMPWAPWRYQLNSYDWNRVRAEIDTMNIVTGPIARKEAGLRCVIMDIPGGDTVVAEFVLGVNMPANHIQPLLDTWEHVRRFMQREGPLFSEETDQPNPFLGRQNLWRHLMAGPREHLSGSLDMLKIGFAERSFFAASTGILGFLLLPFIWIPMLWGFLPWLSGLAKREPKWPADIMASVGGMPLIGANLAAWRTVVPRKKEQIPHLADDSDASSP